MSEVLASLRKLDFPKFVSVAITQADYCLSSKEVGGIPGLMTSHELAEEISSEFIFCLKGNKKLNNIEQLLVIDMLLNHFSNSTQPSDDQKKYQLFSALFRAPVDEVRFNFLAKILSVGIVMKHSTIFHLSAAWLQTQGCTSDVALFLCKQLVNDYCLSGSACALQCLPQLSSHFTCCFLVSLTALYPQLDDIPSSLLPLIVDWVESDSTLCLVTLQKLTTSALYVNRAALWTSPTKPNTQTPLPGLVRWCIRSSIVRDVTIDTAKNNNVTKYPNASLLWSRLHLAILQTIVAFPSVHASSQLELFTLTDMSRLVRELAALAAIASDKLAALAPDASDKAADKLLQVLQVSLSTGAFRCSLGDLKEICGRFPPSRLLTIIRNRHLPTPAHVIHSAS